jgi:hypothetical protein
MDKEVSNYLNINGSKKIPPKLINVWGDFNTSPG